VIVWLMWVVSCVSVYKCALGVGYFLSMLALTRIPNVTLALEVGEWIGKGIEECCE